MKNLEVIGNTIKELRNRKKIGQKELADSLGISKNYISAIERGVKVPSVKLLLKTLEILSASQEEKEILKKKFLKLLGEIKYFTNEDEVKEVNYQSSYEGTKKLITITKQFIERLKADLNKPEIPNILKQTIDINKIERGEKTLTQEDIINIAKILNQKADTYLLLTLNIPEEYKIVIQNESVINLMRSIKELKEEEMEDAINSIQSVINFYIKHAQYSQITSKNVCS